MLNKTISTTEIKTVSTSSSSSESRINDLESRLERELQEIKAVQVQILEVLKSKELESVSKPTILTISQRNREEVESEVLNALNIWDIDRLVTKLQIVEGIAKKKATNIAKNLVAKRPFKSLREVVKSGVGIGEKTMAKIIAAWTK
jgi:DNA uptake protein ComE-like DNA-binding protein